MFVIYHYQIFKQSHDLGCACRILLLTVCAPAETASHAITITSPYEYNSINSNKVYVSLELLSDVISNDILAFDADSLGMEYSNGYIFPRDSDDEVSNLDDIEAHSRPGKGPSDTANDIDLDIAIRVLPLLIHFCSFCIIPGTRYTHPVHWNPLINRINSLRSSPETSIKCPLVNFATLDLATRLHTPADFSSVQSTNCTWVCLDTFRDCCLQRASFWRSLIIMYREF